MALKVGDDDPTVRRIDDLLGLVLGGEIETVVDETLLAAAADPTTSDNKQALKFIKDKAAEHRGVTYLRPGGTPLEIPDSRVRAFVLGPPYDAELLSDEDPKGSEAFPDDRPHRFSFGAATTAAEGGLSPFSRRFATPFKDALGGHDPFFTDHYGRDDAGKDDRDQIEVLPNAPWRRIDNEWLYSAEMLALKLNAGINNTSLVIAFELPTTKKVLLFVGDAQRGNWLSWQDVTWTDGEKRMTPRDLLARTVLYKVGHHGSHNATLDGTASDDYANLSWMATDAAGKEFTAMITAVEDWARTKNRPPWVHPLPSIKSALIRKAQGRVFQTDTDELKQPQTVPDGAWQAFLSRTRSDKLYFDYMVLDT
ncbi:MAG: hypothetical protein M3457_04450 [Chloroflexota bacterium]|nr:hypothetical protein [Chloroflexota bacterium]